MLKIPRVKVNPSILHLSNQNHKFLNSIVVDKKVSKLHHFVKEHVKTVVQWDTLEKIVHKDQEKQEQNSQVIKQLQMMWLYKMPELIEKPKKIDGMGSRLICIKRSFNSIKYMRTLGRKINLMRVSRIQIWNLRNNKILLKLQTCLLNMQKIRSSKVWEV